MARIGDGRGEGDTPRGRPVSLLAAVVAASVTAACASAGGYEPGSPENALPPIPRRDGELAVRVIYPDSLALVGARDSNFVFGSVGTGAAELRVNGARVPVEPNGAFLAWLPVPSRTRGDTAVYRLVARAGGRTDSVEHRILLPTPADDPRRRLGAGPESRVWVDTASAPRPVERWALPDEELELSVRAAPEMDVWVAPARPAERHEEAGAPSDTSAAEAPEAPPDDDASPPAAGAKDHSAPPATETRAVRDGSERRRIRFRELRGGRYELRVPARRLRALAPRRSAEAAPGREPGPGGAPPAGVRDSLAADSLPADWLPPDSLPQDSLPPDLLPAGDTVALELVATDGADTLRINLPYPLRVLDPDRLPVAELRFAPDSVHGEADVVVGRPLPSGSYQWRFPDGSRAAVDGRLADRLRLRLAPHLHAWVSAEDAGWLAAGTPAPETAVGPVRVVPRQDRLRVEIPLAQRVPAEVHERDDRSVAVTLYGARSATERMAYGPDDPLLESLRWRQLPGRRYRLVVRLARPVWGHRLTWEREGRRDGPGGTLRLDLRRPPRLDPESPLRGVRVAVDPGHPPRGATGPTGLEESEANLAISRRLVELLREAGAQPILLRRDTLPLGLYDRRARARARSTHLLVSVHNNALPDGVRPFGREGTSTYYFHPHSLELARAVQRGMLRRMGLRDLGLHWGNLVLPRASWMPSVLTEGAFMMFPRHEAALRTPAFRDAYARGVLEGIEAFLARRAGDGNDD